MNTNLVRIVIVFVLFVQVASCSSSQSALLSFRPEESSPFKIIFSYPDTWNWESPLDSITSSFGVIYALDPYPAINPKLPEGHRFVNISVSVDSHPKYSMQESITLFLREPLPFELLDDRTLQIDGHDARWITIKRLPDLAAAEAYINATFIEEHIFLFGGDRYYDIIFRIPADELNGQFHTEFKAMVESIQFLP